jgi:hypothetical protein
MPWAAAIAASRRWYALPSTAPETWSRLGMAATVSSHPSARASAAIAFKDASTCSQPRSTAGSGAPASRCDS